MLRGEGQFVSDLTIPELEGVLTVAFVRSYMAHATVSEIDVSEALEAPGVVAVFTAADLDLTPVGPRIPYVNGAMGRPWLADGTVRFVGEPVAMVVAETAAAAEDAAELVFADYEPLDVVVDPETAEASDTLLFPEAGTNLACALEGDDDSDLFADCEVVVSGRVVNQRLAPCPLEARATAAHWDGERLHAWISTQAAHSAKGALARAMGLEPDQVHVTAPDVGGGFGAKISIYPEDVVTAWAARRLDRPVRWVESRSESMVSMGHGRDHVHRFRIGGDRSGRVTAYELDVLANAGAYPTMAGYLPAFTRQMAPGTYDIEKVRANARVVVTNTMSIEAYRGAGRPEATASIERAMDQFAAEIEMDPSEVRRINLIPPSAFPFETPTGSVYDQGAYEAALDKALESAGYGGLRVEQQRRRAAGDPKLLGIGVSTYVEITAGGSPPAEFGSVVAHDDGTFTVTTGSSPHGQGLHTSLAMIAADRLGVDMTAVTVIHGDTDLVPKGMGTMGSRSLQTGGSAVLGATQRLRDDAAEVAARLLEAPAGDVTVTDGRFHVVGTPAVSVGWPEVVAESGGEMQVDEDFVASSPSFPFGAHVAVVEVDSETGLVTLDRLITCDDAGTILNPMLVEGQRHGGIAQGVAQALQEEFRYDEFGNPLTANFADYSIISAMELPTYDLVVQQTPTPNNPLGARGIGESGTIGSTPAVQSAVVDALAHLGVRHVDMPASPERVWEAIEAARSGSES